MLHFLFYNGSSRQAENSKRNELIHANERIQHGTDGMLIFRVCSEGHCQDKVVPLQHIVQAKGSATAPSGGMEVGSQRKSWKQDYRQTPCAPLIFHIAHGACLPIHVFCTVKQNGQLQFTFLPRISHLYFSNRKSSLDAIDSVLYGYRGNKMITLEYCMVIQYLDISSAEQYCPALQCFLS